jgi:hypothetical protein
MATEELPVKPLLSPDKECHETEGLDEVVEQLVVVPEENVMS